MQCMVLKALREERCWEVIEARKSCKQRGQDLASLHFEPCKSPKFG